MGRPSLLTPALQERICVHLRAGLFRKHAAEREGVGERTFAEWMARGAADEEGLFADFHGAVIRAEAEFVETTNTVIASGFAGNPKLALSLLGRRFPALYGRRDNVEEVSVEDRAQQVQVARDRFLEAFEKLTGGPTEPSGE